MKIVHLSDLHLGKRVNEYSMTEDQKYILAQITDIIDAEKPDCVIIAGDIYDKSVPPAEAVGLFDDFLVGLSQRELQVFVISGNHDSPERLSFGGRLMELSGVHLAPVYNGEAKPFTMKDWYGPVNIYMLPFIKPVNIRKIFDTEEIATYTDALRTAAEHMAVNTAERNVLVTHQFVTGADRTDSEEISAGGTDNVDASVFDDFDYVALGHIHRPQNVGSERIRYCGTPLKYSFSEVNDIKSVTVAELGEKGQLSVRTVPLVPVRDMKEIRGTYSELTLKSFYENTSFQSDYMHITLTDEDYIPDAAAKLRVIYRSLMKLDYDNTRTRSSTVISGAGDIEKKTPLTQFSEFYRQQNGSEMTEQQEKYMDDLIKEVWEGEQ